MNRNQFTILIALVVIVGGLGLWQSRREKSSYQTSGGDLGQKPFAKLAINDVAQIRLKNADAEVNLVKNGDTWKVKERGDYPANYSSLADFLRKLTDVKVAQSEQVGPSQLPRLELVSPESGAKTNAATLVELRDKGGKVLQSVLLGKKQTKQAASPSPFGGGDMAVGRWIKIGSGDSVALVSDSLNEAEPKPADWLDKEFFKVEKARSVSVTRPEGTNSWSASKESESGSWKLADLKPGEEVDTNKVTAIGSPLSFPSFNDVVVDTKPAETGADKPTTAKIDTFDNFSYNLSLAKGAQKGEEEIYNLTVSVTASFPKERTPGKDEKPEDKARLDKEFKDKQDKLDEKLKQEKKFENRVFAVTKWTVDALLKDRKDFLPEKKEEPKKEEGAGEEKKEQK